MKQKTLTLLTCIMIAMSISGFTYAHWSDTIHINGTVNTGELRIEFTKVNGGGDGGTVTIIDPKKVEWTITNAYPGWSGCIHCTMTNLGTIPLKFKEAKLTVTSDPKGLMAYMKSALQISYDHGGKAPIDVSSHWVQKQWTPFDELDDKMNADSTLLDMVLDPSGWLKFGYGENGDGDSLHLKIDETAPNMMQSATLTFVLEITFKQWNQ